MHMDMRISMCDLLLQIIIFIPQLVAPDLLESNETVA